MTEEDVAAADAREASRAAAMKAKVVNQVNSEIGGETEASNAGHAKVTAAAENLRDRAIDETVHHERSVGHARNAARGSQFIDYGFFLLYMLLSIRLVLALIAARSGNGFVRFVSAITDPFYAPFKGIVDSPTTEAGNILVVPIAIALVVYMLLHVAINGMLRMVGSRKTSI